MENVPFKETYKHQLHHGFVSQINTISKEQVPYELLFEQKSVRNTIFDAILETTWNSFTQFKTIYLQKQPL